MSALQQSVHSTALTGRDVVCVLSAVRIAKRLPAEQVHTFIAATWFQWRTDAPEPGYMETAALTLIDFWFMFRGDLSAMEAKLLEALPEPRRALALQAADAIVDRQMAIFAETGGPVCQVQANMTAAPHPLAMMAPLGGKPS